MAGLERRQAVRWFERPFDYSDLRNTLQGIFYYQSRWLELMPAPRT